MWLLRQCKTFKQYLALCLMLICCGVNAQDSKSFRKPANFVPNDDVIIVPLEYETHFLVRHIDPNHPRLARIKNQLELWVQQEQYVREWGIEDTGLYVPPTQEQRFDFFRKNFLRYVSRTAREPLKRDLREWWNADDAVTEVQRIKQTEEEINRKEKAGITKKISKTKVLSTSKSKKFKYKLRFRPRVLKGYAALSFRSNLFNADSVLGVNGRLDLRISRNFSKIGLNTMFYYDINDNRMITSISKRLTPTISTSITSTFTPDEAIQEDHRLRIGYSKSF